eukprot:612306-Prorocentrum_minimum.AAC.5
MTPSSTKLILVAVLFDFDGTLGDTETPAMEVAYWELAPYFASITPAEINAAAMADFIRNNAGKAFEHMVEVVDEERKAAGLGSIAEGGVARSLTENAFERESELPYAFKQESDLARKKYPRAFKQESNLA